MGYLRDIRRLTVALSRARLGLYILGRREVFESCFELKQAFDILLQRPDKLQVVTGELFPSQRNFSEEDGTEAIPGQVQMENVEHLGQYVFEMTNSKVQQLRAERGLPATDTSTLPLEGEGEDLGYIEEVDGEEEEPTQDGFEAEEA